jgi:hypothetical protein
VIKERHPTYKLLFGSLQSDVVDDQKWWIVRKLQVGEEVEGAV